MKSLPVFLLLLVFSSPAAFAEETIPLGERLVYDMTWVGVPIGTAEVWVKEKTTLKGRPVFHVVGTMQTNKVLSTIYPVRNEIHSWIDAETLHSLRFEKNISEGKTKSHQILEFDKPTHDVLSAVYWVRRQALLPGRSVKTAVIADKKEWMLEVVVMKREVLEPRGWGSVKTILVEPRSRVAGMPEKKGKSLMSLLDDDSKIPLRITYKAPFGVMAGVLAPGSVKDPPRPSRNSQSFH